MCGIVGIFYRDNERKPDEKKLKSMTRALHHRGPDSEGYYVDKKIGLGHTRLSIIDLKTGDQPIANEDNSIWVTFNGEIYNYIELKGELIKKGHVFKTETDTEVIVHLYEEFGEDFVNNLQGMFAFALWDSRTRRVLLARDRFGIKPLFYFHDSEKAIWASEMKAIIKHTGFKRELNLEALNEYLSYYRIISPKTILKNIKKLRPGHFVIIDDNNKIREKRYWNILDIETRYNYVENNVKEELLELLKSSVKMRMISDVPLGSFLSGGMDSSTVVSLMSMFKSKDLNICSVGFLEDQYNELPYARYLAEYKKIKINEFIVKPSLCEVLEELVYYLDEPLGDSSMIPTYYVSKTARNICKVALSGDGGDEVFAGYSYRLLRIAESIKKYGLSSLFNFFSFFHTSRNINILKNINDLDLIDKYAFFYKVFEEEEKKLLIPGIPDYNIKDDLMNNYLLSGNEEFNRLDIINKLLYLDLIFVLENDILVKVDRMSMANSLEVRIPFLDHKLVEFVFSLPGALKQKGYKLKNSKYILKKTLKDMLPQKIITRRKRGFGIPLMKWLRGDLNDLINKYLNKKSIESQGIFNYKYISNLKENIKEKRDATKLWTLLILKIWIDKFLI